MHSVPFGLEALLGLMYIAARYYCRAKHCEVKGGRLCGSSID